MSDEPCFILDSEYLQLEKILIQYNGIPIYYICTDRNHNYYIVLCVDIDNEKYYIVKSSVNRILDLLTGKITMRNILLAQRTYWEVLVGDSIENDVSQLKVTSKIDHSLLPIEDSNFILVTEELKKYCDIIRDIVFPETDYSSLINNSDSHFKSYYTFCVEEINSRNIELIPSDDINNISYKTRFQYTHSSSSSFSSIDSLESTTYCHDLNKTAA